MKSNLRLLAAFACLASFAFASQYSESEKFTQTYPLAANGTLRLSNVNGEVDVVAWDRSEVLVEAEKRAASPADLARIHIDVDAQPDRLVVKSEHEKSGFFRSDVRGEVLYHLEVPAGITIEKIGVVNSAVTVRDVHGPVTLETVNGSIRASGLGADAKLETVNGSIHAAFSATSPAQNITAESVNGACEISLPAGLGAHLNLSSVNGSTRCDFPITIEKSTRTTLRGTIGDGRASLKANTVNGSIRIVRL